METAWGWVPARGSPLTQTKALIQRRYPEEARYVQLSLWSLDLNDMTLADNQIRRSTVFWIDLPVYQRRQQRRLPTDLKHLPVSSTRLLYARPCIHIERI